MDDDVATQARTGQREPRAAPGSKRDGETGLAVRGLARILPDGRRLFDGLDLTVRSGELVAIIGESGVGKSTLLNILAGLDGYDEGTVRVAGRDLSELDENGRTKLRREAIGFVFQAFHILPYLTLSQNVGLPLALVSSDRSEIETKAREILASVGLGQRGDGYARDLSGGELQRVAIARALVHDPMLILADEPTGNLDAETAQTVLRLFASAVRERSAAAIIVTHSRETASIADRILTLTACGLRPLEAK